MQSCPETSQPSAPRSCPWAAVDAVEQVAAAVAAEAARPFGRAFAAESAAGIAGSAAPDSPCTAVAEVAAAVQSPAVVPESQYTAVALVLLQSLWAEAPFRLESLQVAGMTAVAAGHTEVAPVGHYYRPLSTSWTQRTWWASCRGSIRGVDVCACGKRLEIQDMRTSGNGGRRGEVGSESVLLPVPRVRFALRKASFVIFEGRARSLSHDNRDSAHHFHHVERAERTGRWIAF
jgi:hypothetical protein